MELVEREIVCLEAAARPVCLDACCAATSFLLDYASLRSRALNLNSELPQVSPKAELIIVDIISQSIIHVVGQYRNHIPRNPSRCGLDLVCFLLHIGKSHA